MYTKSNTRTKIKTANRLGDAINISLRDIIMKNLLTEIEMQEGCNLNASYEELKRLNFFVDQYENYGKIAINFSINGEPAIDHASIFKMFLVPGRDNDAGVDPYEITGTIIMGEPDTVVEFKIPTDKDKFIFSQHANGYAYSNYVIYSIIRKNDDSNSGSGSGSNSGSGSGGGIFSIDEYSRRKNSRSDDPLISSEPATETSDDTRLLMCSGKIYKTNILYDLVESKLDGQ